ncbi:uncharacterized protein B0T23DRAFT_385660 [Neurospora hispaniola]|uniref:Uncharacterized protein n=1 Tax=Neurospora hispaniola TaxID=588809 RepID=A0AAJ0I4C7_9PEZI|nr:hypothetical protein B0T23DRAFT_385660 [Neurospora hispaniola]
MTPLFCLSLPLDLFFPPTHSTYMVSTSLCLFLSSPSDLRRLFSFSSCPFTSPTLMSPSCPEFLFLLLLVLGHLHSISQSARFWLSRIYHTTRDVPITKLITLLCCSR